MALQVWLPLTKDLRNQGLSNVTVTNNGATFNSAGKLGGCYAPNGLILTNLGNLKVYPMTIAFWCKTTNTGTPSWEKIVVIDDTSNSQIHGVYVADASRLKYEYNPSVNAYNVNPKEWHHYTFIINNGDSKVYVDGVLNSSSSETVVADTIGRLRIGTASTIQLNDVRIYDHCLSEMEVKQLSQGLVLHYTLGNKSIESTTNLFYPLIETSRDTNPAWDKTLNGNYMIYCNGFGPGYNGGVSNPTMGYHGHWTYDENNNLIGILPNLNSVIGQTNRWLGLTASVSSASIGAGNSYTISWEQKTDNLNCYTNAGYYYKKNSSESGYGSFHDGTKNCKNTLINTWQPMEISFTLSQDWDGTYTGGTVYFYGHYGSEGTTYLRNLQFETKNHATAFVDGLTTRTSNIIYDCSGFCNNGVISGNLVISNDTPKYQVSTYFNGSSYILTDSGTFSWFGFDKCTIAAWFKPTTTPGNYTGTIGISHDQNAGHKSFCIGNYGGKFSVCTADGGYINTQSVTLPVNEWHHCVATLDGTTVKMYVDGELVKTYTLSWGNTGLAADTRFQVGIDLPGSDEKYTGYYSDIRVYATALSPSDVKSLYQNCATIDSDGTIHGKIR